MAQFHDTTGSGNDSQVNYGPCNVGAGYQITRVRARGALSWDYTNTIDTAGTGNYLATPLVFAVQFGATGFTPTSIGNSADEEAGNNFIEVGHLLPPSEENLISFATTDANNIDAARYAYNMDRLTQIYTGADGRDVYLSIGYNYSFTSGAWRNFGSLHVVFQ